MNTQGGGTGSEGGGSSAATGAIPEDGGDRHGGSRKAQGPAWVPPHPVGADGSLPEPCRGQNFQEVEGHVEGLSLCR